VTGTVNDFIHELRNQIGIPYVFGGDSPSVGFDCSGLVFYCAAQCGVAIARTSEEQFATLQRVGAVALGDVIFFDVPSDTQPQPAHEAVYLGGDLMIEAPFTGERVRVGPIPPTSPGISIMGFGRIAFAAVPPIPPPVDRSIIAVCLMPKGDGYFQVGADGGVFAFGSADYNDVKSLPAKGIIPGAPIVDAAITPTGRGLLLADTLGQVYALGDARGFGNVPR
jgi:NlpC/P60 family